MAEMKYTDNEYLQQYGVKIGSEMTTVAGRILEPPTISYNISVDQSLTIKIFFHTDINAFDSQKRIILNLRKVLGILEISELLLELVFSVGKVIKRKLFSI